MTDCNRVLKVRKRVNLRVKPRLMWKGHECDGIANTLPYHHSLEIVNDPSRGFWPILAHEWVHLHVGEAYPKLDEADHGPTFQLNAAALELRLQDMGWTLCNELYNKELDDT